MLHQARNNRISAAGWLVLLPVCLIVSGAVLLNAASQAFRHANPSLALALNPLNTGARVDLALRGLQALPDAAPDRLRELIEGGIRLSPIDARFYSLMGILEEREGDRASASRLFDHALVLLPTEFQALIHKLAYDMEAGDFQPAVERVEIIGRRWSKHWPLVEPVLPALLSNAQAFDDLVARFGRERPLRDLLIGSLGKSDDTLSHAYRVLLGWHRAGVDDLDRSINYITRRLIELKRYADAFLLFRLTRPPEGEGVTGYVYNDEFTFPSSGNPFDWRLRSQAGVDFEFVGAKVATQDSVTQPTENGRLVMRFLNNPVQLKNVAQFIRLAPGQYRLAISYSSHNLSAPEPLQLAVRCVHPSELLATIELQSGSTDLLEGGIDFAVPSTQCGLQEVYIFNAPMPMSWRNRYTGAVHIDRIAISRAGN